MISGVLALLAASQPFPPAYHVDSLAMGALKPEEDRAAFCVFTPERDIVLLIGRDMKLRWVDLNKPASEDVVRRGELTDQPTYVRTKEEQALYEKILKDIASMGMENNEPKLKARLIRLPGNKEFCLTDAQDELFFYSTSTGELLRKVKIKGQIGGGPMDDLLTADQKYVSFSDTKRRMQMVYSMETGNKLFEVPKTLLDSSTFTFDSKSMVTVRGKTLTFYSLPSGTVTSTVTIPDGNGSAIASSPVGPVLAFSVVTPQGDYGGARIYDYVAKKFTVVDPALKQFGVHSFSPDGKILLLQAEKWLHVVDTATGYHRMTIRPYFTAMWNTIFSLHMNETSDKIILCNESQNNNPDLRYSIKIDLKQKPGDPVKKPIIRT